MALALVPWPLALVPWPLSLGPVPGPCPWSRSLALMGPGPETLEQGTETLEQGTETLEQGTQTLEQGTEPWNKAPTLVLGPFPGLGPGTLARARALLGPLWGPHRKQQ